jgi:hypothetical protein
MFEEDIEFFNYIIGGLKEEQKIKECQTCIEYLKYLQEYYKDTKIKILDDDVLFEYKKITGMKVYITSIATKY